MRLGDISFIWGTTDSFLFALAKSFPAMLCQMPFDVALLRLHDLFLAWLKNPSAMSKTHRIIASPVFSV